MPRKTPSRSNYVQTFYPGFIQDLVCSSDILFVCTSPIPFPSTGTSQVYGNYTHASRTEGHVCTCQCRALSDWEIAGFGSTGPRDMGGSLWGNQSGWADGPERTSGDGDCTGRPAKKGAGSCRSGYSDTVSSVCAYRDMVLVDKSKVLKLLLLDMTSVADGYGYHLACMYSMYGEVTDRSMFSPRGPRTMQGKQSHGVSCWNGRLPRPLFYPSTVQSDGVCSSHVPIKKRNRLRECPILATDGWQSLPRTAPGPQVK